jgi:hypothetical protein
MGANMNVEAAGRVGVNETPQASVTAVQSFLSS